MSRILVVEDDLFTAENISEDLGFRGYDTIVTHSPEEAIMVMENEKPDLILMDIHLNGKMDGVELAAHINQSYSIPVLYLTDDQDDRLLQKIQKQHRAYFMNKPFRAALLAHTIDLILQPEGQPARATPEDFIFVKVKTGDGRKQRVFCKSISYLRADRAYCKLYTLKDEAEELRMLHLSSNMAQTLRSLPQDRFLQVHRSYAVNLHHVKEFDANDLYMQGEVSIPLGENFKTEFLKRIRQV
ncbi:MAG TPA: hypothetical protein DCG19_10260 [Cryomorphaceae bacterium]|nr:hypothetical protein [Owenweeksia sp.]HAD97779.1 hypothetical protein [Cryomorphaceae bacterium]|tara:strand:- start:1124 stop:1849 length:726 start_codon:yes stop_codon:yes gene_type:complete